MFRPHNSHKLLTKEDPFHVHKFLGVVCLLNYGYRYYLLIRYGSMNLNNNNAALLVGYHMILSVSSLVFHIPSIRNTISPMIYPEYRLHSILFVMRSVVCYFLTFFGHSIEYKIAACYLTMLLADAVTARYKSHESPMNTTMRNMPFDTRIREEEQQQIILMQSSQQIGATLYMLGNLDSCFSPMFAIQIAAFLMTMVRKSIIDSNMWHIVYSTALWMNALCFYSLPVGYLFAEVTLFQVFYYWRFSNMKDRPRMIVGNKYIGWTIVFAIYYYYQTMRFDEKVSVFIMQNMDMVIRRFIVFGYLVTQTYKCRGLLVAFRPKTG
jgi:hypothetical protein